MRRSRSWPAALERVRAVVASAVFAAAVPLPGLAQTDYYNTDRGRPIQIEDAYSTERYAFELQLAPLRLERGRGGSYTWSVEPEVAYGILPRTQLEVGLPLHYTDVNERRGGLAGLEISALYNLNAETRTLPAFGVVGEVLAPVGPLAPDDAYVSAKAIATRTYRWARVHLNGQYTFGDTPKRTTGAAGAADPLADPAAAELSRWLSGVAIDRSFPLTSLLVTAETYARRPIDEDRSVEWSVGAGVRYQLSPQLSLDAGLGKRLTGEDHSWFVTVGLARAFAIRALMPGR